MQLNSHQPTHLSSNLEPGLPLLIGTSIGGRSVHGGTPGVEQLAGEWATRIGLRVEVCRGDWLKDEEIAILQRNGRMLQEHRPDGVIIFPGAIFGDDLAARAGADRIAVWRPRVGLR